jgi:transcriptional regulator with XRE-family HTH domain
MSKDYNRLGKWLGQQLLKHSISPEVLANRARVSRASVYFWMADITRPGVQSMVKVCQVLNVPLEEGLAQYTPKENGRPAGGKKAFKAKAG